MRRRLNRLIAALATILALTSMAAAQASVGQQPATQWQAYYEQAVNARRKQNYGEAERAILKSLSYVGRDVRKALASIELMERIYDATDNLEAKEATLLTHLKILQAHDTPPVFKADVYFQLGELYSEKADFPNAEKYCLMALPMIKKAGGDNCFPVGIVLNNLAFSEARQNKIVLAAAHFKQALAVFKKAKGEKSVFYGMTAVNLGDLYEKNRMEKLAVYYYLRAVNALDASLGTMHPATRDAMERLGAFQTKLDVRDHRKEKKQLPSPLVPSPLRVRNQWQSMIG